MSQKPPEGNLQYGTLPAISSQRSRDRRFILHCTVAKKYFVDDSKEKNIYTCRTADQTRSYSPSILYQCACTPHKLDCCTFD